MSFVQSKSVSYATLILEDQRPCLSVITSYRGYNIGTRLIEDFLARSGLGRCSDFKEVGEVVAKVCYSTFGPLQ